MINITPITNPEAGVSIVAQNLVDSRHDVIYDRLVNLFYQHLRTRLLA